MFENTVSDDGFVQEYSKQCWFMFRNTVNDVVFFRILYTMVISVWEFRKRWFIIFGNIARDGS